MPEYQRLISYIYAYENGKKGKNAGFAKIESRNGNCKIYLSMMFSEIFKNEGKNSSVQVYLYTRENGSIRKHYLDEIPVDAINSGNQNTVSRIVKRQEAFDRSIEEYAGLLICTSEFLHKKNALSLIYASEWDDISIRVEEFQEESIDEKNADIEMEKNSNIEISQEANLEIAYISDDEYETVESATDVKENINNVQEAEQEEVRGEEVQEEEQRENMNSATEENSQHFFKVLCSCYPKVQVKELGGECIRITPHDISYLPKQYWSLSNNSFLLHGYYNYRYLILCEKIINDKKVYILAVPGLFHQKEQNIAQMFGFTEFEGNRRNAPMNFGYWCMCL